METLKEVVQRDNFLGWVGEKCYHCGATHNIEIWSAGYAIGPGGFHCCRCGHYIVMSQSYHRRCFRRPDFGYNRSLLMWVTENFARFKDYLFDTKLMLIKMGILPIDVLIPVSMKAKRRKG